MTHAQRARTEERALKHLQLIEPRGHGRGAYWRLRHQ